MGEFLPNNQYYQYSWLSLYKTGSESRKMKQQRSDVSKKTRPGQKLKKQSLDLENDHSPNKLKTNYLLYFF